MIEQLVQDDSLRVFSHYLDEMKYLYLSTEKQLIEFSEIVPFYKNDWKVYSPRLYSILQLACSQVESMIKRIADEMGVISKKQNTILPYYQKLNKNGLLEKQMVMLVPAWQTILPFNGKPLPGWWLAYNQTKHQIPHGVMSGTIENTVNALAALYCLHNLGFLIMHGTTYDVIRDDNWGKTVYSNFPNRDIDYHNNRTPEITHKWKSTIYHHTRFYADTTRMDTSQ